MFSLSLNPRNLRPCVDIQRAVTLCGWEGNRRSCIALALCYRLQWFIHLRAEGLEKEKERKEKMEEYLYSAIYILCISQSAQAWITVLHENYTMPVFLL